MLQRKWTPKLKTISWSFDLILIDGRYSSGFHYAAVRDRAEIAILSANQNSRCRLVDNNILLQI